MPPRLLTTQQPYSWLCRWVFTSIGPQLIDKRTLASRLGMTPENLSRSLAQLARHGLHTTGHRIIIDDRGALERFGHPNALIDGPHSLTGA